MKRNFIIRNIIIGIIVVALIIGVSYYFINKNGKKYEIAKIENYNYFVLKENNLYGVIDGNGNTIIPVNYDSIKIVNKKKAVFVCYKNNTTQILNEKNQQILENYQNVEPIRLKNITSDLMYEKTVFKYQKDGKYGLVSIDGKKITDAKYESIEGLPYKEGELIAKINGKLGVINIKGNKLVNFEYDKIEADGYYTDNDSYKYAGYIVSNTTTEGYRFGYINYKGKLILKPEYNQLSREVDINDNENAYIICAKNGQFGITKNENSILPNEYQSIDYDDSNDVFTIEKSKKYGIANLEGKIIVPPEYDQIDINGIYLYAKNNQGTTVYNSDGTQANIDVNIAILKTANDNYRIKIDNKNESKYGIIGKSGEQLVDEKYSYIEYLTDNYFIVSNDKSKLGVIDNKDNVKIEINNDSLQKLDGTDLIVAKIANDNLTKVYSKSMNQLCEMSNAIIDVKDNYVKISNDDETKYYSKDGNELKNTDIYPNNTLFANKENGKWGFVNKDGKTVVEAKYDKVTEFNKYGYAAVEIDNKWGSINSKGEVVVEPTYTLSENTDPIFIGKYYQVKYGFGEIYYTDLNNNN